MRWTPRDAVATLLVAAAFVPYVGYLVWGGMPFIQDPRGMAATALVLGVLAFVALRRPDATRTYGPVEIGLGVVTLAAGVTALVLAEAGVAEPLLAIFMIALGVMWGVAMLDHVGMFSTHHGHGPTIAHR